MLTFNTVSAACNKNEAIIIRLQNIPASFNECPAPDPLQNKTKVNFKEGVAWSNVKVLLVSVIDSENWLRTTYYGTNNVK